MFSSLCSRSFLPLVWVAFNLTIQNVYQSASFSSKPKCFEKLSEETVYVTTHFKRLLKNLKCQLNFEEVLEVIVSMIQSYHLKKKAVGWSRPTTNPSKFSSVSFPDGWRNIELKIQTYWKNVVIQLPGTEHGFGETLIEKLPTRSILTTTSHLSKEEVVHVPMKVYNFFARFTALCYSSSYNKQFPVDATKSWNQSTHIKIVWKDLSKQLRSLKFWNYCNNSEMFWKPQRLLAKQLLQPGL